MNLWTDDQLVVTLQGPGGVRELAIGKPFARVGGHPDSEVVLEGPGVAKRALYLHATSEGVFCLDLDVEDSVAHKRGRWMLPQDTLQLGPYSLSARLASGAAPPQPRASPVAWGSAGVPLPVVNVHCQRLLKDKRRFRARLNVVGRRPQCALQLRGARVSSFHCVLFWDQRRLFCVDLLSSNGTQLNGEKFDCGEIRLNDRLDVGEFTLVYYRWSPRRSMQPGWRPEHDPAHDEHEPAEGHDASPVLDAASPPSGIEADLALATHLAEEEGSGLVRDAGAPAARESAADRQAQQDYERLRQELAAELERLTEEREHVRSQAAALDEERARSNADREEFEAARGDWQGQRQGLELQAADHSRQLDRLETELAAVRRERESLSKQLAAQVARLTQEHNESEARIAELAQRQADQSAQAQAEVAQLVRERTAAQAAKGELQAERDSLAAHVAESARQMERLKAELAAANEAVADRQATIDELTQQRDAALELTNVPRPAPVSPEQVALRQQLAADVARLTQERDELHAQWTQSSERFSQQIAQLSAEAARHAAERDAAAAAHDQWQRERQRLNDQLHERGQQLAAARAEVSAAAAELAQRQAELAQREAESKAAAQQKDALLGRLNQERRDLQAQWATATQQLAAQVERSQEQASRLAEQRRGFDAEREAWLAERSSQAKQLAERSQQLDEAKQSLAAARAALARREAELEQLRAAPESFETAIVSMTPAPPVEYFSPVAGSEPPGALDTSAAWAETLTAAPPEAAAGETLPMLARAELPSGRRNKAQKQELTTFVGDRLIDLEQVQRRRSLILWASVAAGTIVLSALIFGGWYFFR